MFDKIVKSRYAVLLSFILVFLASSFIVRSALFILSIGKADFTFSGVLFFYLLGFVYDVGVAVFLTALYSLYLLLLPGKWLNSTFNKAVTYAGLFLILLISFFSFFAELTFWQEFESRFNFIAVDYLIYTYEVVNNINESYPLPLLIGGVVLLVFVVMFALYRKRVFRTSFQAVTPFKNRLTISGSLLILTFIYPFILSNSTAESSTNRYQNELAKAGIYSFFSAFKNNELNYYDFYSLLPKQEAYKLIRAELQSPNTNFVKQDNSITRNIESKGTLAKPNVIMITVESLSADYMEHFGNTQHLMPVLDSLADHNLLFTNMYATGTRTVRGMEALTLSIPPTPGNSVVRRPGNENLQTVGYIFKQAGYGRTFYYGGDGYFDNMNEYFGSNGFDITDRGRNIKLGDSYSTRRKVIADSLVHFENAWGICDEDLFDAVVRGSDEQYKAGKPFYSFVMTTSNHRPYTFPDGKIDMSQGSRKAAVRYTDFAIGQFLKKLSKKLYYKNTVVIIVADHCASSAGKNEIDISKYHIPCLVLNLPGNKAQVIDQMCSQIDLYPTLFSLLGWKYQSNLYGKDVLEPGYQPRALVGTYQKLAYLKKDSLVILGPQQKVETYLYDKTTNEQQAAHLPAGLVNQAKANYQTAYDLFKNGGLHQ